MESSVENQGQWQGQGQGQWQGQGQGQGRYVIIFIIYNIYNVIIIYTYRPGIISKCNT